MNFLLTPINWTITRDFTYKFYFLKEFPYIALWFPDQNSKPLEIEDIINLISVIDVNIYLTIKIRYSIEPKE